MTVKLSKSPNLLVLGVKLETKTLSIKPSPDKIQKINKYLSARYQKQPSKASENKQWGEARTEPRSFPPPRWDHISVDNAYPGDCGGRLQVVRSPDGDRWVSGARCSISMGELSLVTFFGLAHRRRKFASKESSAYSKLSFSSQW